MLINPCKAKSVSKLVNTDDFYVLLLVMTDDVMIHEVIVLKGQQQPRSASLEDYRSLYPSLPTAQQV